MLGVTLLGLFPLLFSHVSVMDYLRGAWLILVHPGSFHGATSLAVRMGRTLEVYTVTEIQLLLVLFSAFLLLKSPLEKHCTPYWGLVAWAVLDAFGVNAAGSFGHQIRQLVPSLAVISAGAAQPVAARGTAARTTPALEHCRAAVLHQQSLVSTHHRLVFRAPHAGCAGSRATRAMDQSTEHPQRRGLCFRRGRWVRQHRDGLYGTARSVAPFRSIPISAARRRARNSTRTLSAPARFIVLPDNNTMWLG